MKFSKAFKKGLSSLSIFGLLMSNLTYVHAEEPKQQLPIGASSETFNAQEVNRILAGLTAEQKANINKLTGAEQSQKIHLDPKDLRGSGNINVIVQFKTDFLPVVGTQLKNLNG